MKTLEEILREIDELKQAMRDADGRAISLKEKYELSMRIIQLTDDVRHRYELTSGVFCQAEWNAQRQRKDEADGR